jgi:hypothetical protein
MPDTSPNLIRRENLVRQVEVPVDNPGRPPGFYKELLLNILSLISATFFGFSYIRFLGGLVSGWMVVLALVLFGVLSGLQALTNVRKGWRILVIAGEVLLMSMFFYAVDPPFLSAAAILTFIFLSWGYLESRRELFYATEIRFYTVTHDVIGKLVTGMLLFMIVLYVPQRNSSALFVSEHTFSGFFNWAADTVQGFYPNIPLTGSVGDFAETIVTNQLKQSPQFQDLSPQNQSTTIASNAGQFITNFSNSLKVQAAPSDSIASVIYRFIIATFEGWQNHFASAFIIGWTVVLFLVLRSIGIVFSWLSQLVLLIVYEILMALGFVKIGEEPVTKEVIRY